MKNLPAFLAAAAVTFFLVGAGHDPERRSKWDAQSIITFNTGDAVDASVNRNNGTLNNGTVVTAGNRYASFDGTDDNITIPDSTSNDLGSAFTICMWFQPSTPGSAFRYLASKWNTTSSRRSFLLAVDYTANQRFGTLVDSVGTGVLANTCQYYWGAASPPTSGWNFIAWTYDNSRGTGNRHKLFLNGTWLSPTATAIDNSTVPLVTPDPLLIAGNWKGDIDEFKLFKRLLTDAEVAQLYSAGHP